MPDKPVPPEYPTIDAYNRAMGIETLHPLVSAFDMSTLPPYRRGRRVFGFYAVFLKDVKCGDLHYGRQLYDYQEGTIVCTAPGQIVGVEDDGRLHTGKGWGLLFHPDLVRGTVLGTHMKDYGFFSYKANEALHLSEDERETVVDGFKKIRHELEHPIDRHSVRLITITIEMLLDYFLRFYERQFVTRANANHDVLARFEMLLDDYLGSSRPQRSGLPTVKGCAGELCLSPNYFGDLVKKETGKTAQEYIQFKLVSAAKDRLYAPEKSIGQIAYELGFQYPQHFTRLFKRLTGQTPADFRAHIG